MTGFLFGNCHSVIPKNLSQTKKGIAMSKFKLPSREMIADREDLIEASNAKSRLNRETIDFDKPKANRIFRVTRHNNPDGLCDGT